MSRIVNIDDHRPHEARYVVCMKCAHDWVAVSPVGVKNLECSECGEMAGEAVKYKDLNWFSDFMGRAIDKKDQIKRTMVLLNAKRMGL